MKEGGNNMVISSKRKFQPVLADVINFIEDGKI